MPALCQTVFLDNYNSVLLFYGGAEHNKYTCTHEKASINICICITKLVKLMCIVKNLGGD